MPLLTKEQILSANDVTSEVLAVPEWGGDVKVHALSGLEKDRWEAERQGEDGTFNYENARASLVAACLRDEQGKLLFSGDDVKKLGMKSARALDRVFAVCKRLNGVTEADMQELEKNS